MTTLDNARAVLVAAYADQVAAGKEYDAARTSGDAERLEKAKYRVDYYDAALANAVKRYNTVATREQHEQRVAQFGRGTYETA
jgi:hypothetical protein